MVAVQEEAREKESKLGLRLERGGPGLERGRLGVERGGLGLRPERGGTGARLRKAVARALRARAHCTFWIPVP